MQTISSTFLARSRQSMRPLAWQCRMSFEKQYDDAITFFTIGTSVIGGGDFIPGASGDVVQEWDKYEYNDLSSRLLDQSITRQNEILSAITFAMADIVLDNHDDYFTPGKGSEIDSYILPSRPVRLYSGFGNEVIPMFIGLTSGMPKIDEKAKTATFHCVDFMTSLMDKPLNESVLYTNVQAKTILEGLFLLAGIDSVQLDFDNGFTIFPYIYFEKGDKLGKALQKIMDIEQGRIFMNEKGVICFRDRQNYEENSVYDFDAYNNIIDISTKTLDDVINVVEIKGKIRQLQPKQKYWEASEPILIPANSSIDIWADFEDPVTTADDPVYITSATTSLFTVNTESDGSGSNDGTSVTLSSSYLFAKSKKMTFANSSSTPLYITTLELFATPIKVISELYLREEDSASTDKYEEHVYTIENDFFQSETDAESVALMILRDYSEYGGASQLDVKGCPALQLDDPIKVDIYNNISNYKIVKIIDGISFPAQYKQILTLRKYTPTPYFTIAESLIAGPDLIRP